jgi:hypothetical protein
MLDCKNGMWVTQSPSLIAGVCARLISIARMDAFAKRISIFRGVMVLQSWIGGSIELLSALTIGDGKLHSPMFASARIEKRSFEWHMKV